MHNLAHPLDIVAPEELASNRHRPARGAAFPAPPDGGYDAREAAYLWLLLADPLRELARTSADVEARVVAEEALASQDPTDDSFADHARFEDALSRIASTTTDDASRVLAEAAVALYRGR